MNDTSLSKRILKRLMISCTRTKWTMSVSNSIEHIYSVESGGINNKWFFSCCSLMSKNRFRYASINMTPKLYKRIPNSCCTNTEQTSAIQESGWSSTTWKIGDCQYTLHRWRLAHQNRNFLAPNEIKKCFGPFWNCLQESNHTKSFLYYQMSFGS